ncbi:MAG: hypothetical protein IJZ76_02230 [Lachnospiraceae bacterium]|nr:hypothetical protein [Lachnospiraceae bacterium]
MKKLRPLIKKYGHMFLPVIYGIFYMPLFVYMERRPVTRIHIIESDLDAYIPFCEYFIVPYLLWFVYIGASVIAFMFLERKDYYRLCTVLGVGMTAFLLICYIYPNGLHLRPATFARDNIFVDLVRILHRSDTATNVLPGIHCYNSLAVHAAIRKNKTLNKKRWIKPVSAFICFSVVLSTLFLKQHSVIDVIAAFILFAATYTAVYLVPDMQAKKVVHSKLSH